MGIRHRDAIVFEKSGRAVLVKKAGAQATDFVELKETVEALAKDMRKVAKYVKVAERALAANFSGHVGSQDT